MSIKEEALKALDEIRGRHRDLLKETTLIRRALDRLKDDAPVEPNISCFYAPVPNVAIPLSQAQSNYYPGGTICPSCNACQTGAR